jgi:hypothetical protein
MMSDGVYQQALTAYVRLFETMTPASLETLNEYFASDALFEDPFNAVQGVAAIQRIFAHMYEVCEHPEFTVLSSALSNDMAWLYWDFTFTYRSRLMKITGVSMVRFSEDGLVLMHTDYWDAASQLYEKLPLIGRLVKGLHRLFSVKQPVSVSQTIALN